MFESKGNFKPSGSGRVNECESDTEEEDSRSSQVVLHDIKLKTYTGEKIKVLGEFQALVTMETGERQLPVVAIESSGVNQPTLFGRNWMKEMQLDWRRVGSHRAEKTKLTEDVHLLNGKPVPIDDLIMDLKKKYSPMFEQGPEEIKGSSVNIVLKENARPVFCKTRNVPFSLRKSVEKLEKLQIHLDGIIYPVAQSEWATPIVVVPKPNNEVRLCGDFKVTTNPCLRTVAKC